MEGKEISEGSRELGEIEGSKRYPGDWREKEGSGRYRGI